MANSKGKNFAAGGLDEKIEATGKRSLRL